ncbi:MAG: hypothetical protein KF878_19890 [Planctomycetes bacterium]|nr:hypothetical protein [Planctomycetota bacterium]
MLLAELFTRALLPQQLILVRPDLWAPDDGLGWRNAPLLDTRVNTGDREVRLVTDARGHRVAPAPAPAPPGRRVLALGDSFLVAMQVEHEDTFAARLERSLSGAAGAPVTVTNTGVSGWAPSQYLLEARRELARERPDLVLVCLFLGNDIEDQRVDHYPARERRERSLRLPRGLARRELIDAIAYPVNDWLETRSHLFALLKQRGTFLLMRLGLSARRFPDVCMRREASSTRWAVTADLCAELAALAAAHGAPTLWLLLPGIYQADPTIAARYTAALGHAEQELAPDQAARIMSAELTARGLRVLDATPALRAACAEGAADVYGLVDTHLGREGHRRVADLLHGPVLELLERGARERQR